ncbi:DUF1614 domain-containing protein [Vulcanisaeta souniana]|uniref:DUF1614 domain-containing protein n=1 Tax=Vulcanisaeta souniana JCM 11219 TaxID=1293586 RepID=A0ABN6SQZ2_9CREN|nr:DUF1614 domain-containing protein [Vulcanisaeta souniana]BDR92150.1 hypothetical protein Vsou_12430 [Vulcanisaeta souniana JCM 11219]
MSTRYDVKPRLGIRFSLPMSILLFIGLLVISPLLLFIFLVLVSIGIQPLLALTLTLGSLLTSYVNIMIAEVTYYMPFTDLIKFFPIPIIIQRVDKLFLEVNVGGAVIPIVISIYLITEYLTKSIVVIVAFAASLAISSLIIWQSSRIIPNIGITLPTSLPVLLTLIFTLIATTLLHANPLAFSYSLGSLSTLLGADILNVGRVIRTMRGYVSIGGAGVFDGIYITSLMSLILASLYRVLL